MFVSENNNIIKNDNDKRRLLHFALMEYIKKNHKNKKELLINRQNYKNIPSINSKLLFQFMNNKFTKKIDSNIHSQNGLSNMIYRNKDNEILSDDKNPMFCYNHKNSSFYNDINTNIIKKKERRKYINQKRVKSTLERNKFDDNELFDKNIFEEKDIVIDNNYEMKKRELINNNIVSIRRKNKNSNINLSDCNNVPFLKKEPLLKGNYEENKNKQDNKIYVNTEKNFFLKKNKSLININAEYKEKGHKKIKSSYLPNDINDRINSQRNDNFFKDTDKHLSVYENKKNRKKVFEYIYDNNFNAEFHFKSIKFRLGSQKKNKYGMWGNFTDNKTGEEDEEIIVKAFEKQLFINNGLMNNNKKFKQNNSTNNKIGYNMTSTNRKSTEENENNSSTGKNNSKCLNKKNNVIKNTDEKNEMKKFYRTKYDKFDMKNSILYFKEKNKKDNQINSQNDINKSITNTESNKKKNYRDKFYNTVKLGFANFTKNNKIIKQAPIIINTYITKRRKNNNDDIIDYI